MNKSVHTMRGDKTAMQLFINILRSLVIYLTNPVDVFFIVWFDVIWSMLIQYGILPEKDRE